MSSPPGGTLYLDSSALVKLIVREDETDALQTELARWPLLAAQLLALPLGDDLTALVTYDIRMRTTAERYRLATLAPSP